MWLPLIFLFMDRALTRRSYKHAVLAGVFFAMQFFCGFMANQIYYAGAIVLYYLFFAFRSRDAGGEGEERAGRGAALAMMLVTLAVGFALSATQWAPVMELLQYSNRRIVPIDQGYIYLPPWYIATLVFPNLFGAARDAEILKLFTALHVSHDHILYLGIVSLLPLGFSLYSFKRAARRVRFFTFLAVLALLIMMAAPLYVHLTRFIPVVQSIRVITRGGVLFVFAASVLIGFGADLLLSADALQTREVQSPGAQLFGVDSWSCGRGRDRVLFDEGGGPLGRRGGGAPRRFRSNGLCAPFGRRACSPVCSS